MVDFIVMGHQLKLLSAKLMVAGHFTDNIQLVELMEPRGDTDNAQTQSLEMVELTAPDIRRRSQTVLLMEAGLPIHHILAAVLMAERKD